MAMILLWMTLMGLAVPFAASLECFQCTSIDSMKDCIDFQKKTPCPRETDRCRNMTVHVYVHMLKQNVTGFQRGCASQYECLKNKCTGHFAEKYGVREDAYSFCRMSCCEGNLCPEGNVTTTTQGPVAIQSGSDVAKFASFFVTACAIMNAFFL